jgi:ribosome production factor 1
LKYGVLFKRFSGISASTMADESSASSSDGSFSDGSSSGDESWSSSGSDSDPAALEHGDSGRGASFFSNQDALAPRADDDGEEDRPRKRRRSDAAASEDDDEDPEPGVGLHLAERQQRRRPAKHPAGATGSGAGALALRKDLLLRELDPLYAEDQPEVDEKLIDVGFKLSGAGHIRTVSRRRIQYQKAKQDKKRMQAAARKKRKRDAEDMGDAAPLRQQPRTLDNTREPDDTVVRPTDVEVLDDAQTDGLAQQLASGTNPHILITTCVKPSSLTLSFIDDLISVIPKCDYYKRRNYGLKEIVTFAKRRTFTDIMVIGQNRKQPNSMILTHLPDGPTATFKLSSIMLSKDIPGHGRVTGHKPELVLNNFNTRLGHTVGRMFAAMFPPVPQFQGRRVATFHNQRDYIFFRHHRYMFAENSKFDEDKAAPTERDLQVLSNRGKLDLEPVSVGLQELGPRFTLKLRTLQHGTFDTRLGEYEWFHRKELDTSKRRFFL